MLSSRETLYRANPGSGPRGCGGGHPDALGRLNRSEPVSMGASENVTL